MWRSLTWLCRVPVLCVYVCCRQSLRCLNCNAPVFDPAVQGKSKLRESVLQFLKSQPSVPLATQDRQRSGSSRVLTVCRLLCYLFQSSMSRKALTVN